MGAAFETLAIHVAVAMCQDVRRDVVQRRSLPATTLPDGLMAPPVNGEQLREERQQTRRLPCGVSVRHRGSDVWTSRPMRVALECGRRSVTGRETR